MKCLFFSIIACYFFNSQKSNTKDLNLQIFKTNFAKNQSNNLPHISEKIKKEERYKSTFSNLWKRSEQEFPLDSWLYALKNSDSLSLIKKQIDSMQADVYNSKDIRQSYYKSSNVKRENVTLLRTKISFNLSEKWILKSYYTAGNYSPVPHLTEEIKNGYISYKNKFVITGKDIFEIFNLSDTLLFPLNYFPPIYSLKSTFNNEWHAILTSKYNLVLRYVSSSHEINQDKDWQFEKLYIFERKKD